MEVVNSCQNQLWSDIPGFFGYQVSTLGHVKNVRDKLVRQRLASNGSLQVNLGKATQLVHNLVLRAFTGHPTTRGFYARHLNGDISDNRLENLVWAGRPR